MWVLDAYLDTAAFQGREGIKARHPGYPDSMGCPVEDLHTDGSRRNSCKEKPRAVSWKPKHKPGVVAFPWSSQGSVCDPTSEFCGCAGPPDREAQKCHFQGYFGHFYICDHSGQLKGHDFFWGTPSSRCWSGSHQECQQFPLFPMENSYGAPPWL